MNKALVNSIVLQVRMYSALMEVSMKFLATNFKDDIGSQHLWELLAEDHYSREIGPQHFEVYLQKTGTNRLCDIPTIELVYRVFDVN